MPIRINYLHGGAVVEYISSGVVTGLEIIEANKKLYQRNNIIRLKYKLIDRSTCTAYRVTREEMKLIAAQDEAASKINRDITVLLVAPTDLQYGMTRMWQMLVEETGFRSEIFQDRESADAWLKTECGLDFEDP